MIYLMLSTEGSYNVYKCKFKCKAFIIPVLRNY